MPTHVRIFWWLIIALVAYRLGSMAWGLAYFSPRAHGLERLDPALNHKLVLYDKWVPVAATMTWAVLVLPLAWLIAFRRRNWARWVLAVLFLFLFALPMVAAAKFGVEAVGAAVLKTLKEFNVVRHWIVPTLEVAAIIFVFTGDARGWFGATASSRSIE